MRVIVCGGRDWEDQDVVRAALGDLPHGATVVHGAARGADRLAGAVAAAMGLSVESVPAQWRFHGRAAGPIRNRLMLDRGADLVIAFPGGAGTADMVSEATRRGVPVREVNP